MLDFLSSSYNKAWLGGVLTLLVQFLGMFLRYQYPDFYQGFWTGAEPILYAALAAITGVSIAATPNKNVEHVDPKTEVVVSRTTGQPTKPQ